MKWRGRKGNNLHRRCAQDGSTLSSLPLRKIPRSSPSLPATLSSFGHFYHGYHNYSTRSRSNIRKLLLHTKSCIPCVVALDLCAQSSFPLLVAQISACLFF